MTEHECSAACARDHARAARFGRRLDEHLFYARPSDALYRRLVRARERTACVLARAEFDEQLQLCACLVGACPGG